MTAAWWKCLDGSAKWLWIWRLGMLLLLLPAAWLAFGGGEDIWLRWRCWLPMIAGGLAAAAGWYGCMAYWMARTPGGLKGWRFGLLLIPGIGLLWSFVELGRAVVAASRGQPFIARQTIGAAVIISTLLLLLFGLVAVLMICLAVSGGWDRDPRGILVICGGCLLLWGFSFDIVAGMLNNLLRFREVEPYSSARRRRELALVILFGIVLPLALAAGWWGYWTWRIRVAVDQIAAAGLTETIPEELRPDIAPEAKAELRRFLAGIRSGNLDYRHCERWNAHVDRRWRKRLAEFAGPVAEFDRWLDGETRFDAGRSAMQFFLGYYWMALRLADADGDAAGVRANLERMEKCFTLIPAGRATQQYHFVAGLANWAAAGGLARLDGADLKRLAHSPLLRDIRLETRILLFDPELVTLRDDPAWTMPWLVRGDAEFWELIAGTFGYLTRDHWEWSSLPASFRYRHSAKFDSVRGSLGIDFVQEMHRRAALLLIALERYRRVHGGFPERLEELTPEFLDAVPLESYSGLPADYEIGEFTRRMLVARAGRGRTASPYAAQKPKSKDLTGEQFNVTFESVEVTKPAVRLTFGARSFTMPLEVEDE